jgi:hypothetical protein
VRVSDRPMARGRSKPCAAGPSVEVGSAPSKQNKTVAGQSARRDSRGAKEEEDRQEELKAEAIRRAAAASQLIGRVMSVASQAVEESRARKEPLLAMAGRFTRPGGCGCDRCAEAGGADGVGVLALRKCKLRDVEREAMVRVFQAGWKDDEPNGSRSAEQLLEEKLAGWFPSVGCEIMERCGAGVHPFVAEALDADMTRGRQVLRRNFWIQMLDGFAEQHGPEVVFSLWSLVPPLPAPANTGVWQAEEFDKLCEEAERCKGDFGELCEEELDSDGEVSAEEESEAATETPAESALWLPLKAGFYMLTAAGMLVGLAGGLLLAARQLLWFVLASGAYVVWRGLLYAGITVPVAAAVRLELWLQQARREVVLAAEAGALTPAAAEEEKKSEGGDEEDKEGEVDQEEKKSSKGEAARGQGASHRKKAVSVAGRRRRMASARQQHKVWDPGD